ncbi:hypothetical protein SETIT_9G066500v2 [Setaria italica]|uniref:Reverse transcriptase zinc-binding domain-containing protein n=1 Tax=Setaria italica TaxID=4555 RepID=A0A368SE06_SETIT|nr:hypothetical protein SETIT_9G066500v2 [Setaria italica]
MTSVKELFEFVNLWDLIQGINFTDNPDDIVWRWISNGDYSAKSAYAIQFKGAPESAEHLCIQMPICIVDLAAHSFLAASKEKRRALAAVLIYTCWNLWKERNRRIFEGIQATPQRVFSLIKEEINMRQRACGAPTIT